MFKISTRKGLGLGAVVALATTLFSGAPAAQAAVAPVTLAGNDSYGTYTVPFGTNFDLKSFVTNSALGGYWGDHDGSQGYGLKYNVKNVSANHNYAYFDVAAGIDGWDANWGPNYEELGAGNDYSYDAYYYGSSGLQNDFAVAAQNYDNNTPIKLQITAWVDTDGDYNVDPSEESAVQTITWVDPASLATTTKIADTYEGADSIDANVTFANKDINVEQVGNSIDDGWDYENYREEEASAWGVYWTRNATDEAFSGYDDNEYYYAIDQNYVYYDSDLKAIVFPWTNNIDGSSDSVAKGLYTAQLYSYNDGHDSDSWDKSGTKAQATVAANVVDHVGAIKTDIGANVINSNNPGSHDYIVRSGTKSITYTATVYKSDNTAVGAGIAGKFYISDDGLGYSSTITAGGKTLTSNGNDISVPVTTDANGKISVTITASALDGDEIYVWADVRDETSNNSWSDSWTYWEDTNWQVYGNTGDDRSVAVGGSSTFTYRVEDQFNQPAGSDFQVVVTRGNDSNRDTQAAWSYTAGVSNGAASVTVKDNGAGYGDDYVYATLQKKLSGGGFSNYGSEYTSRLYYTDAALVTVSSLTATVNNNGVSVGGTAVKPVKLSDLSKFVPENENQWNTTDDFNYGQNTYPSTSAANPTGYLEVEGTVSAALVDAAYVPVTISLPGAVFETNTNADSGYNNDWFTTKDSITLYTDADGYYYAYIYSDVPGKQTVTVTSGGKTKTVDVTFAQSTPKSVALSVAGGAASAQAGRSVPVAATVKDANGHVVSGVTVTFAAAGGSGALSATTAVTNASGVATVNYLTTVADTGSVDFTATAPSGSDTLTSSKVTVSFVRATGNVTHAKAVVTAHWSSAKGQSVLVTVDGYRRFNQVELSDAANFFSKKLKKGRHTVNLYVGGVLVDSLKFTVKK